MRWLYSFLLTYHTPNQLRCNNTQIEKSAKKQNANKKSTTISNSSKELDFPTPPRQVGRCWEFPPLSNVERCGWVELVLAVSLEV